MIPRSQHWYKINTIYLYRCVNNITNFHIYFSYVTECLTIEMDGGRLSYSNISGSVQSVIFYFLGPLENVCQLKEILVINNFTISHPLNASDIVYCWRMWKTIQLVYLPGVLLSFWAKEHLLFTSVFIDFFVLWQEASALIRGLMFFV